MNMEDVYFVGRYVFQYKVFIGRIGYNIVDIFLSELNNLLATLK